MANIKFTKNELHRLQDRLKTLQKYLPTLQLKKALLQVEVNKMEEEIARLDRRYQAEKGEIEKFASLLTHLESHDLSEHLFIEEFIISQDSIAGIDVPTLEELRFKIVDTPIMYQPIWFDDLIQHLRSLKKSFEKVRVAKEKRDLLAAELRTVSIRVNLFEKRLIPEAESHITQIKAFLSDLEIAQIAIGKVTKSIKAKKESIR